MPTPPKESIGGFVQSVFDAQKSNLVSDASVAENFINSPEFQNYDDDFKIYTKERWYAIQRMQAEVESLDEGMRP